MARAGRARRAAAPLMVLAALLAAAPAGRTSRHVEITVDQPDSLADTALAIKVTDWPRARRRRWPRRPGA